MKKQIIKDVFKTTIPVMLGYLSIGFAFGVMVSKIGLNYIWAGFMSIIIYAGSMQYMAVDILSNQTGLLNVAIISLIVQARHMVYGLSMLDKFKGAGKLRPYMIFSLTDETYALLASAKPKSEYNPKLYYFLIGLFNHIYWITGSVAGAIAGAAVNFNAKGIDFAMTALFIVICTEQIMASKKIFATVVGLVSALLSLLVFGKDNMLIPAIISIILILFVFKDRVRENEDRGDIA